MHRKLVLVVAMLPLVAAPLAAQRQSPPTAYPTPAPTTTQPAAVVGGKSAGAATLLSLLVPGGGQMYAGEVGNGLLYLGTTIAAPIVGLYLAEAAYANCDYDCDYDTGSVTYGVVFGASTWLWSVLDAGDAARRTNAKMARTAARSFDLAPSLAATPLGETRVGLRVSF